MGWILVLIVLVLTLAVAPRWPYSRTWGYAPSGLLAILMLVLLVLVLIGML